MKNLNKIAKGLVIPLAVAGIMGCMGLSNRAYNEHVQLYNGFNPMSVSRTPSEESGDLALLGNTNYFVEGRKQGTEEKKKESAVNRSNLLAYFLLKHWNKTGENPLVVLGRASDDYLIDEHEFFNLVNSLERDGDVFIDGRDIQYKYFLDSDGL